jgi:hypothetical protein
MSKKRRSASTPGPKPSPLAYKLPLAIRINEPMMKVLRKIGTPSTSARVALMQWMLEKKYLSPKDMPE